MVCNVLFLISEFLFAKKSQENASKLVLFLYVRKSVFVSSVFPFVQLYFPPKCMLCGLCWNRLGQIIILIKTALGFPIKKQFSYISFKKWQIFEAEHFIDHKPWNYEGCVVHICRCEAKKGGQNLASTFFFV